MKSYRFNKINLAKWLMVNFKIDRLPNVHIVDRYLATLKPLGVKPDSLGLDYFIPEKDEVERDWLPDTHRAGYVAYAIGAQHNTKKLPVDRMIGALRPHQQTHYFAWRSKRSRRWGAYSPVL